MMIYREDVIRENKGGRKNDGYGDSNDLRNVLSNQGMLAGRKGEIKMNKKITLSGEIKSTTQKINVGCTGLMGYISIPFYDLETAFGNPIQNKFESKVNVEWHIMTPFGPATIYDWKLPQGSHYENNTTWNIGGKDARIVELIEKALNLTPFA